MLRAVFLLLVMTGCRQSLFDAHGTTDGGRASDGRADDGGGNDGAGRQPCAEAIPGIIAFLPLDEGTGSIATDHGPSATPHNATVYGTTWQPGRIDDALAFDTNTDYADLGSASDLDDLLSMTVCAWIYTDAASPPYGGTLVTLVDKTNTTGYEGWSLYMFFELGWHFSFYTNFEDNLGGDIVPVSTWTHVCATWDGTSVATGITLYRDGVLSTVYREQEAGSVPSQSSDAANAVRLGSTTNPADSDAFQGRIDEVVIYDRALAAPEIQTIYQCAM